MPRIVAVAHSKGGVGKSTLATNLAVAAALAEQKVLLVDTDTQASSTLFVAARPVERPRIQIVQMTKPVVHRELPPLASSYDLTVIDTGGRDSSTFRSALVIADLILIPLTPAAYDVWASEDVLKVVDELAASRDVTVRLVINQLLPRTVVAREALEHLTALLARYPAELLTTRIHSRVAWKQASGEGLGVGEWEPLGAAARELTNLCNELHLPCPGVVHETATSA